MGHDHSHAAGRAEDRRRLLLVLVVTGTVLVAELVGAWLAGSLSLLADAAHMADRRRPGSCSRSGASYVAARPGRAALDLRLAPRRDPGGPAQRRGAAGRLRLPRLGRRLPAGRPAAGGAGPDGRLRRGRRCSPAACSLLMLRRSVTGSLNLRDAATEVFADLVGSVLVVIAGRGHLGRPASTVPTRSPAC